MKPTLYIETTVVSYYTARPSRDVVIAGRQEMTREVWPLMVRDFAPDISALVLQEARQGDAQAAQKRLETIKDFPVLNMTTSVEEMAERIIQHLGIPQEYPEDALHIAVAAMNGMDFLLTWNFAHINNALTRSTLRRIIEQAGYICPEICSPDELHGEKR
jgi:hypothetical protein